jgi:hypothetical protein
MTEDVPQVRNLKCTKEQVEAAIPQSRGLYARLGRLLGVSSITAKKYIEIYDLKEEFGAEVERMLDIAEDKMYDGIEEGDGKMIRFYLSNKGRARGYGQGNDTTHDIKITVVRNEREELEPPIDVDVKRLDG